MKVHRHTKAPLAHISFPKRRIAHVNVDLVGPLPPFFRFIYLLTMTDRKTRWLEAVPLSATTPAELVGDSGVHIAVWVLAPISTSPWPVGPS